jgi:ribokinase
MAEKNASAEEAAVEKNAPEKVVPEKVVVLGSFVVDLMGRSHHLPAPGETVMGSFFRIGPGGKGSNQAVAAHRAGADVHLITKLGKDVFRSVALDFYTDEGMDCSYIFEDEQEMTGAALILVDENTSENSILVHSGACGAITAAEVQKADDLLSSCGILLCQLEINLEVVPAAVERVHEHGGLAVLNPAPAKEIDSAYIGMFDLVTPNEIEASILTGVTVTDLASARMAADQFNRMGVADVIITLGSQGAFIKPRAKNGGENEGHIIPAFPVNVVDTTGAGDAFNGALVTALAEGQALENAAEFAMAAAALSVTKIGTAPAMAYRADIEKLLLAKDRV